MNKHMSNHKACHAESFADAAALKHPQSIEIFLNMALDKAKIKINVRILTRRTDPL